MRERITASVLILVLVLLAGGLFFRQQSLQSALRDQGNAELAADAAVVAELIEDRLASRQPVHAEFLTHFLQDSRSITYSPVGGRPVTVVGDPGSPEEVDRGLFGLAGEAPALAATTEAAGGMLTLRVPRGAASPVITANRTSMITLIGMVVFVTLLASLLIGRWLAAPFRQLAKAAASLGRGRFDVDLPRTRIPEARAIASALAGSADHIHERLQREHTFAEHASHVLRTPLTGLRMELEELSLRTDLPEDARETAARGLSGIQEIDAVAGQLVELSRSGVLVEGAELPLRELASSCAQRWADELAPHDRLLTAAVEGEIDLTYTPGPVEHLLELLLGDVLRRGAGAVRMVFEAGTTGLLTIKIVCGGRARERQDRDQGIQEASVARARAMVTALGGRLDGDHPAEGLVLRLPRR